MSAAFQRRSLRSFTLIELILVLTIISVVVAVSTPSLIASIRGNRLRTASRLVVTSGRYARSMAVMKQVEMAVNFDIDKGTISVVQLEKRNNPDKNPADEDTSAIESRNKGRSGNAKGTNRIDMVEAPLDDNPAPAAGFEDRFAVQRLDRVKITSVEIQKGEARDKGTCVVDYRSNGTCDPYVVKLTDQYGVSVTIEVDALSSVKTESGR
jgi:type II secretory pathway pseudopilin PulG